MEQWDYSRFNQQFGPMGWEDLRARAARGGFTGGGLVWKEGMANWVAANTIPGLIDPSPSLAGSASVPVQQVGYYGGAGYGPAPGPKPDSPLAWAIASTLCCCLPFGIVAIVYAAQVN